MAKSTQTLIYNELTGYHDEALQLLDRMQIPLNQSSDGFPDAASHVSPINCANAYLTLAQGSRFFWSPQRAFSCPSHAMFGERDARQSARLLSHIQAIWMVLCKLCEEAFSAHPSEAREI